MIKSKAQLQQYIKEDNAAYMQLSRKERLIAAICRYHNYEIMRFKKNLRMAEYYFNTASQGKIRFLKALYYERRKNKLGYRLGLEIDINCFDSGLVIYHGGIVVNPNVRAGKNCQLHGGNCIGNNGKTQGVPTIGDNADLGYGACIIGEVRLADDVTVGCNAVVVHNCDECGAVLVGIPAKKLR